METTVHLELPFIMPAQAQKHVTHNEALSALDALVQISLRTRSLDQPVEAPEPGARYLVGALATGAWEGKAGRIASFTDGAWLFLKPRTGFLAWVEDEGKLLVHSAGAFVEVRSAGSEPFETLGINATADETNRLAVRAAATLLSHETGSHRLKVNKAGPGETASLIFSSDHSARAEIGLAGTNDLAVKVSADGATFIQALAVNSSNGMVAFPRNLIAEGAVANIMRDGGRFSGSPEPSGVTAAAFAVPQWVALHNGAALAAHGKFVRDSQSYGGPNAAIDADIRQLAESLIEPTRRRLYPEFHVARLTAGDGTTSPIAFPDGTTRYSQFATQGFLRPVKLTMSVYVKAKSGEIGIPYDSSRRLFVDGIEQFARKLIPADGAWHHVLNIEGEDFTRHWRYSFDAIRLFARAGDMALIAFPAAVPGQIQLPVNVGQIPGTTLW